MTRGAGAPSDPLPACTACGSAGAKRDQFYYVWHERHYWIHRCVRCTHQFVYPHIGADDQSQIYGDHYFSAAGDWVCGLFEGGYFDAEPSLRIEAKEVLGMLPAGSGRLLDVGCAGGIFLDEARARGFEVAGIELNPAMAERARARFQLDVRTGRLEDIPPDAYPLGFDVVTLLDCLEHIPHPLEAVRKIARWVRPGGYLFIRGPLSNSILALLKDTVRRILRVPKQLPGYPLDANMFNQRSLAVMLNACGIEILAWPERSHWFSNVVCRKRS